MFLSFLRWRQPLGLAAVATAALLTAACHQSDPWPAEEGFDKEGSDPKAIELADQMMERMGGYPRWSQARYLAWTYYGAYYIWDKRARLCRQEKGNQVVLMNLAKAEGKVFNGGRRVSDPDVTQQALAQAYVLWRFSSDFLALPYKLKDKGVSLKYDGLGITMTHDTADVVDMYLHGTGPAGDGRNRLWLDRRTHLLTQWAFYANAKAATPAFVRDWLNYRNYDGLLFATQRNSISDTLTVSHIAVLDTLPRDLFYSAQPVDKQQVQAWMGRKK